MIQVIDRFHRIITHVASKEGTPCAAKELADLLDVSQPTCSNIIRTMCDLGWLEPATGVRGYVLGPTVFRLAGGKGYRHDVVRAAAPIIKELCETIGEYVNLVVNRNGRRYALLHSQPDRDIILNPDASSGSSLYRHATGLVLLAYMSKGQRERYYKEHGSPSACVIKTIRSVRAFEAECAEICKRGYAEVEYKTTSKDKIAVLAFPVLNGDSCELAIGIQIPHYRFDRNTRKKIIDAAKKSAKEIGTKIGR